MSQQSRKYNKTFFLIFLVVVATVLLHLIIIIIIILSLALQPAVDFGLYKNVLQFFSLSVTIPSVIVKSIQLFLCSTFVTISFLLCGFVSPTPNPQPGGPGYSFLSGSSPLTCLVWEAVPVAYATASIAHGIM
jgi:hypothetical protein